MLWRGKSSSHVTGFSLFSVLSQLSQRVFASVILNARICHLQPGFSSDAYDLLAVVLYFRTFVKILLNIATAQLIKIHSYLCKSRWNADTWPALVQDFWKGAWDRGFMYGKKSQSALSQWYGFLCFLFHSLLNHLNHILGIFATTPCHLNALSLKQGQLAPVRRAITSVASRHFMIQWIWITKHLIPLGKVISSVEVEDYYGLVSFWPWVGGPL